MKKCSKCKEEKNISNFRRRKASLDGYHTQCKNCTDANSAKNRQENLELRKAQARQRHLKHKFGITTEQYDELLASQDFCCAICKRHETTFKVKLAVDHNHVTNEIRGLLCQHCNHYLIGRHRDGDLLRKMADYVDQGTGLFVPKRPKKRKRKAK